MKTMLAAALLAALAAPVQAATADPSGDFLDTFTGAESGELDFTGAAVALRDGAFNLSLTTAGPISGSANVLHVWGIDRGGGTARLNALSDPVLDPAVKWDSLAVLFGNGLLRVVTFPAMGAPTFTNLAGGAVIDGNTITAAVPLALLPSRGFAPEAYRFQLWSRLRANPMLDGTNNEIADFGPRLTAQVPEPASWAMMLAGFGLAGATTRRRRPTAAAFARI